ncbi:hypothetical protein TNCV_2704291 [Trichonephila clavipes]|nr:hypothetical protein TNCV_2704291 [Trichonephila clavipes]
MTGQRYIDEVLLHHVHLSVALSIKICFYGRQRNMSSNTRCSGLSRQRGVFSNVSYGQRVLRSKNPIELCRVAFWGASCWSKLSSDKPEHPHPCTHRGMWDKLPQQLLDNVVQKYGTTCGMLHHTPQWIYPVLIPFFLRIAC